MLQVIVTFVASGLALFLWARLSTSGATRVRTILKSPLGWYALFSASAVLSTLYSVNPPYTAYFSLKLLSAWALPAIIVGFYGTEGVRVSLSCVRGVFYVQTLAILLLAVFAPKFVGIDIPGVGYRLVGFDDYGLSGAISIVFVAAQFCSRSERYRRMRLVMWALPPALYVYFSRSRDTIIAVVVALIVLFYISIPKRIVLLLGIACLICLMFLSTTEVVDVATGYMLRGQSDKDLLTGSGRTIAFMYLLDIWKQRPYFGHGYGAGTRQALLAFMSEYGLGIGSGHDIASRTLTDLGLCGALIMAALCFGSLRLVFQAGSRRMLETDPARRDVAVAGALIVVAIIQGFASAGISDPVPYFSIAVMLLAVTRAKHNAFPRLAASIRDWHIFSVRNPSREQKWYRP
jgi:oligosaccharide repeat unit polymerase